MFKCRTKHHQEPNKARTEINMKSNHDDAHCAMDQIVPNVKKEVNPGAEDVNRIGIFRHEEVKKKKAKNIMASSKRFFQLSDGLLNSSNV